MPATARKFELEPQMQERTVLDEKVDHIQRDVAELKADVRRVDAKIDAVSKSQGELRVEMKDGVAALRIEMGAHHIQLKDCIGALRTEMNNGFARQSSSSVARVAWTVGTLISVITAAVSVGKFLFSPVSGS